MLWNSLAAFTVAVALFVITIFNREIHGNHRDIMDQHMELLKQLDKRISENEKTLEAILKKLEE